MKIFLDTIDLQEINNYSFLVDGITTNPSLGAKSDIPFHELASSICQASPGPVSLEVTATDEEGMLEQSASLLEIASNVVIKLPMTWSGLKACGRLSAKGHSVNLTLCFSPGQAILAAKAGARMVSPFAGRIDDLGNPGMQLIADIRQIYRNYPSLTTEILVASVRHPLHVVEAAKMGADIATVPPKVLRQLALHPLTDIGLERFLHDWQNSGQSLLSKRIPEITSKATTPN